MSACDGEVTQRVDGRLCVGQRESTWVSWGLKGDWGGGGCVRVSI